MGSGFGGRFWSDPKEGEEEAPAEDGGGEEPRRRRRTPVASPYPRRTVAALGAKVRVVRDAAGVPHFIECNPLPGLTPGWSDLCIVATAAGLDYRALVGAILEPALGRLDARRRGLA